MRPTKGVILAMGDSLTEGYGLPREKAYPAQLELRLREFHKDYEVVNAGVAGETSAGTLARLDWVLQRRPVIVILATGANDGLRGIAPESTATNIDQILERLRDEGVVTVLAGMLMVRNLGVGFTGEFDALYPQLAQKWGVRFIPFLLEGVALRPELNLPDGIHPNEAGHAVIVQRILPLVFEAIAEVERSHRQ
jgi:acyl-CoA thioesterase-1